MQRNRFLPACLLAALVLTSVAASRSDAQYYIIPRYGPFLSSPLSMPYTPYSNYYYSSYPSTMPYVAPYPAYGILPPPFVTAAYYAQLNANRTTTTGKTAEDYGYRLEGQPRMRSNLYPAVPYEKSPQERLSELRRVHYEITVPKANAVVYIDGAKTKQTGLRRTFVTPPLDEDRSYTATIKVQWVDEFQKTRERSATFNVVAGETVRHTFTE